MGLRTLVLYLIGNREAILKIAATKHALWLGLLFVLSAGFAREYDGEDLLHEPWHLLIPLGASLATCTLLFALLWVVFHGWRTFSNSGRTFTEFLTLYWMTAPLAWIYAIPVERFLDARDAMVANLCLLGLVSVWRVVLIIRVASVLLKSSMLRVAFPVILFADSLLITLVVMSPTDLLALMGGVRFDTSEGVLRGTATRLTLTGAQTWLIWALATLITFFVNFDRSAPESTIALPQTTPMTKGVWRFAASALLIWLPILPFTQPQQWRRHHADRLSREGNYVELLAYLSTHRPFDFPPHWDPPPRREFQAIDELDLLAMLAAFGSSSAEDLAPWVRESYQRKLPREFMSFHLSWNQMTPDEQARAKKLLAQIGIEGDLENYVLLEARIHEVLMNRGLFPPPSSEE